jgi:hypothetical protein
MSVEFYLGFNYDSETNRASGDASVNVTISMFPLKIHVELHCHREFSGGSAAAKSSRLYRSPVTLVAGPAQIASLLDDVFIEHGPTCSDCDGRTATEVERNRFLTRARSWSSYRDSFIVLPGVCNG